MFGTIALGFFSDSDSDREEMCLNRKRWRYTHKPLDIPGEQKKVYQRSIRDASNIPEIPEERDSDSDREEMCLNRKRMRYTPKSLDIPEEEEKVYRRRIRDASNILEIPEERFVGYFRVNKEIFLMLMEELKEQVKPTYRITHTPLTNKLAVFLIFLARGGYQASIGREYMLRMSKTDVSRSISELLNIFNNYLYNKWITLEKTIEEEDKAKEQFYNITGITGIVGCVDGTHIRITAPGDKEKHLYYNRKGQYSINVMLICDHNMVISSVDARLPGSNQDKFIWDQSLANYYFYNIYTEGKRNGFVIGDSNYNLHPYLMTPYRYPREPHEWHFNERHQLAMAIVKRCVAMLKKRFKCLDGSKSLYYSPNKTTQIVNACTVLHNMCIYYNHNWLPSDEDLEAKDDDDDNDVDTDEATYNLDSIEGTEVRNKIAKLLLYL